MKKIIPLCLIGTFALISSLSCSQSTQEAGSNDGRTQDTTVLRFSHFYPSTSDINQQIFEPWAKKIESDSNGRLKVEVYPSATLSKADSAYESTVNGVIDIGSQVQGYTSGRFPLTQIAELPGLSNSSTQTGCILQTLYDDGVISSEYEDSHLLFMFATGPGSLHTTNKPIKVPDDMKGLRIRRPSTVAGDLIESMGASPVGLPANDIYTSLQRGVVDGLSFPWEAMKTFKLDEITKYHTNVPFYSSALVVTMNKEKYESLPDDLKKVIDDNSGMTWSKKVGEMWDKTDKEGLQAARDKGDVVIDILDPLNDPAWKGALEKGTKKYLDEVNSLGLDADTVYQKAKAASIACQN